MSDSDRSGSWTRSRNLGSEDSERSEDEAEEPNEFKDFIAPEGEGGSLDLKTLSSLLLFGMDRFVAEGGDRVKHVAAEVGCILQSDSRERFLELVGQASEHFRNL